MLRPPPWRTAPNRRGTALQIWSAAAPRYSQWRDGRACKVGEGLKVGFRGAAFGTLKLTSESSAHSSSGKLAAQSPCICERRLISRSCPYRNRPRDGSQVQHCRVRPWLRQPQRWARARPSHPSSGARSPAAAATARYMVARVQVPLQLRRSRRLLRSCQRRRA